MIIVNLNKNLFESADCLFFLKNTFEYVQFDYAVENNGASRSSYLLLCLKQLAEKAIEPKVVFMSLPFYAGLTDEVEKMLEFGMDETNTIYDWFKLENLDLEASVYIPNMFDQSQNGGYKNPNF